MMEALDCLFVFQLAVLGLVVLGLTLAVESSSAFVRWLEYRKLRRELKRGRSTKELKAMSRAVRL